MTVDVSVVIATCRRNDELLAAIASVQRQKGVTFEITVVDDSPEGGARAPVEHLGDPRITYLRNGQPTGGIPSIVRNLAWPRATGALLHFLDDDDLVPEGHYGRVKALFERRPEIGLVFGHIEPFGSCSPEQLRAEEAYFADAAHRARICGRIGTRRVFAGQMLFGNPLLVCSAGIVRRGAVAQVGGFDPQIRLMEDADFYARIMRESGAAFLDEIALHYRISFASLMHQPDPPPGQIEEQRSGRRRMQAKYLREHGAAEFYALAAFSRLVVSRL
jgi:GT2 family glycosyltransferase